MQKSITNGEVDKRLINRNIERLDDCKGTRGKLHFECKVCLHIWEAILNNILLGRGCPKCNGGIKLSNEEIDLRLSSRNIKRIENYAQALLPIEFQCLIDGCNHIWKTRTSDIINGMSGCPKCNGHMPLTNKIVDDRLANRDIKRIDNFINSYISIHFQCEKCLCIWKIQPSHILNMNSGCPQCAKLARKYSNEDIDSKLINRNITRIDDYIASNVKIHFKCELCYFLWMARPGDIINNESGCPKCNTRKNEKLIGSILDDNGILYEPHKFIKNIINSEQRKIFVDYHITNKNIIIEYNGVQHYKPVRFGNISQERANDNFIKQQERDKYLQNICDQNNINIIWIDGRKYFNVKLEQIITDEIIPMVKNK